MSGYEAHVGMEITTDDEENCMLRCLLSSINFHFYVYGSGTCHLGTIGSALPTSPTPISGSIHMNWIEGERSRVDENIHVSIQHIFKLQDMMHCLDTN